MYRKNLLLGILLTGWLTAIGQTQFTTPTQLYVMHSSGHHLKMDDSRGGRLEAADAESPQRMTLIPDGQGYYSIKADGQDLFLSLSGNWNTLFTPDSSAAAAKYAIEQATGNYVKLRCKSNNRYLGTDAADAEAKVYSDKSGTSQLHQWYFADSPFDEVLPDTVAYPVVPALVRQQFEGWGVSLCWWANMCGQWDDEKIDELVTWMVSPEGLNYNIFRYNIGGGDDPENAHCTPHHMGSGKGLRAEMEGFKDFSGDVYHWDRDAAQRKIMLKIREKRPDAIFEAFSNSAPYYMTYSGCVAGHTDAGKDNLKPEYYEEFAHYLVDVCQHYKDEYGIEFRTLEPFNEPMTNYWSAGGGQEGCHFSVNAQIAFLKVLQPILQASGLNTVIASSDETDVAQSVKDFTAYQSAGALSMLGQWNAHTYQYSISSRTKLAMLAHQAGLPLWMSEVGARGNMSLAQVLIDDMRYMQPIAWVDWQYMEENGSTWGAIGGSFSDQTYYRMKKYYTRQQCSRFIKPGYSIVTSLNNQSLAALNAAGDTLVLVLLGGEGGKTVHDVNLKAFADVDGGISAWRTSDKDDENMTPVSDFTLTDDRTLSVVLPAQTITTLLIPVTTADDDYTTLRTDCDYLIVPRNETTRCVAVGSSGNLQLADINADAPQTWRLTADGAGYRLHDPRGLTLTSSPYATSNQLTLQAAAAEGRQTFAIETIDWPYCKIVPTAEPQYAMELVGENTAAGTSVKLWPYDDGTAPTHRQWMLVPMTSADDLAAITTTAFEPTASPADGIYAISGRCLHAGPASPALIRSLPAGVYIERRQGLSHKFVVRH